MALTIGYNEPVSVSGDVNPCVVLLLILIQMLAGCASNGKEAAKAESACSVVTERKEPPQGELNSVDDLLTVDCLLPGQFIQLGMHQQWLSPPRPAIISAWECKVQGGQYAIGYNRDSRQTALNVWQQCADQGDKVAQNYLGEIYGRSWGNVKPDFVQAAAWFRRAADQGYSRAQKNLGALYEQGLGVPKDPEAAFKLYRQAFGEIAPLSLDPNTSGEIQQLSQELDSSVRTTKALQQQLDETARLLRQKQEELDGLKRQSAPESSQSQVKVLQNELKRTRISEQTLREQLAASQQKLEETRLRLGKTETRAAFGILPNMGQYYALIIGIGDYRAPLARLKTPVNDAKRIEEILRRKYGFKTTLIVDDAAIKPTREAILSALIKLSKELKEDDNLLIYYAGHGSIHSNRGHWLPQDAKSKEYDASWISSDDIRKEIETTTMKAKHVLIVSDSCYSASVITAAITAAPMTTAAISSPVATRSTSSWTGLASASSVVIPDLAGSSPEARVAYIKALSERLSRRALTSGGFEPVLDVDSGNGLSIFANAFLEALAKNDDVIDTNRIFLNIREEVSVKAKERGGNQVPVYARIEHTGDNNGEFFFMPIAGQRNR